METKVMLSNRHVHLTETDAAILLGEGGGTFDRYLTGDSGPYSLKEMVTLVGPKGEIGHVKILGPFRDYTQAEVLRGDGFKLGVEPPVRATGHLNGAAELKIVGPCGEVTRDCAIIAHRHIHMKKDIAEKLGYENGQAVKVRVPGVRALTFENVLISVGGRGLMMHIDTEEGNAAGVKNMDTLELITD